MKFVKADDDIEVRSQEFDNVCRLALSVRLDRWEEVRGRIGSIEGAQIAEN